MLTALIAVAVAATSPVAPKLDPVKDQPVVCAVALADKMQQAQAGNLPVSLIVPLYTDKAGMSEKDAAQFQHGCDLFEQGFFLATQVQKKSQPSSAPMDSDGDEDEGRAPDRNDDLVAFRPPNHRR